MELLLAATIVAVIIIGISSIEIYSHYHLLSSDRKISLQNDAFYILEDMASRINRAVGDADNSAIVIEDSNRRVKAYIDLAVDGSSAGDGKRATQGDRWTAYEFDDEDKEMRYYAAYPGSYEVISRKVFSFSADYDQADNFLQVQLTTCWDPDETPNACGSPENPVLSLRNRISMPFVSTN